MSTESTERHEAYSSENVDFETPGSDTFPDVLDECVQWMGATGGAKNPFAPWGDRNPPTECNSPECPADRADDPECSCDGRWKWGHEGHYVSGPEAAEYVSMHPDLAHRAFLFQEYDRFLFIDADDVRCPETGEVHPVCKRILARMGLTWTEVSQSEGGLHAVYVGDTPDTTKKNPVLTIDDEPWGAHDEGDLPQIEIYPTKRNAVLTGEHVPGTPVEVTDVNEDEFREILDTHGKLSKDNKTDVKEQLERLEDDREAYEGEKITADTAVLYSALDALNAKDVAEVTIVSEWTGSKSDTHASFLPVWGNSDDGGTANFVTTSHWEDDGNDNGQGGPAIMAAIDKGILGHKQANFGALEGDDYAAAVDHLRELGFEVPEYVPTDYMDVLGEYQVGSKNAYDDSDACLAASLKAREEAPIAPEKEPPTLALHSLIEHILGIDGDSRGVTQGTRDTMTDVFHDLTLEEAMERYDLDVGHDDDTDPDNHTRLPGHGPGMWRRGD